MSGGNDEYAPDTTVGPEPSPRQTGGARQTRTYLMELLEANGLRPKRQLGQNFLIDFNLLDLIARSAEIGPGDVVLEVGAGTGGLTTRLAELAARVVSVEIDPGFYRLAAYETRDCDNVELLHLDALKHKNKVEPQVLEALERAMEQAGASDYLFVANLPYDVSASLLGNLLLEDLPLRRASVTVQREMADRIIAQPGSKDYGPLSVLIQTVGSAEAVRLLSPKVFWPRPKVDSAIVRIDVGPAQRADLEQLRAVHRFVRDLFLHRRKTLRSAIAHVPGMKARKPDLDGILAELGLQADSRAEALGPAQFGALFDRLRVPETSS